MRKASFRVERDSLGGKRVPTAALWGVQTQRAIENFPISGLRAYPALVVATAYVKWAAAVVNMELGTLDRRRGRAIARAAREVVRGRWHDQFVVDVFQAGAGTSHNMNANEVIANRATELLGGRRGDYTRVHPNDQVNMAQSTNDVFPTAMRIACILMLRNLIPVVVQLQRALEGKAREFDNVVKAGRTHLMDAAPIRLGQEFGGYAEAVARDRGRIDRAQENLKALGIGGTAVGTGMNAHPEYHSRMVLRLSRLLDLEFRSSGNLVESMQNTADFVDLSASLRTLAVTLTRIANDLRLLASGPRTGLGELVLPAVQPGSSIMPGKVNPSMAEMLNMVCFQVMGCDLTVSIASQAGQLELNVMMPVIAHNLLHATHILTGGIRAFTERCLKGVQVNRERIHRWLEESTGAVLVLNDYIGYARAAEITKEALASGKSVKQVVLERGLLSPKQVEELFSDQAMTEPRALGRRGPRSPRR